MANSETAKMAGGARQLPKWQTQANLVPNSLPNWHSKYHAKKIFFSSNFFFLHRRYVWYNHGIESEDTMNEYSVRLVKGEGENEKEIRIGKATAYSEEQALSIVPEKYFKMGRVVLVPIHIES
jgi:hypothetical protein